MNLIDDKFHDYGLLSLRVGIGLMFATIHGFPKITGGVQT
jgi:putative oxidoreductase